ncbi:hypothetical protein EDB83DRAFT_2528428 [Lactarius deliciosus]|nr:hypothetical protein EDB83DRAFT_2528428 [Lactarius deliciosus]
MSLNADEDAPQPHTTRRKPRKPLNANKDTPQPRITRAKGLGNTQKSKDTGQQAKPASATRSTPENSGEGVVEDGDEAEVNARIKKATEDLRKLEARKAAVSKELAQVEASTGTAVATSELKIKRPPKGVNIQVGMGLADDGPRYHAIRRCVTALIGEAGINWELPWSQVPDVKKAKLYQAARKEIPYLAKFYNDWPTKELAMQLMKNKRGHSYRRGYIEVPEQYAYLKKNAAKKKQRAQGSRSARATPQSGGSDSESDQEGGTNDVDSDNEPADRSTVASGSTSKHARPETVAAQPPRKKQKKTGTAKSTRSMATAKGKGKKASPIETVPEEDGMSTVDGDEDVADLEE